MIHRSTILYLHDISSFEYPHENEDNISNFPNMPLGHISVRII